MRVLFDSRTTATPLVTVVIPAFRRPSCLMEAIRSVTAQETPTVELVIAVDDEDQGAVDALTVTSPQNTFAYRNPTNLGLWNNVNSAIRSARGDWLIILPDDDFLLPNTIAHFGSLCRAGVPHDAACISGGVHLIFEDGEDPIRYSRENVIRFPISRHYLDRSSLVAVEDYMCLTDTPKLACAFFNARQLIEMGGFDTRCHGWADLAIFLKYQSRGALYICDKVFGGFRVHGGNLSHRNRYWAVYPVEAADTLLGEYVSSQSPLHSAVRKSVKASLVRAILSNTRDGNLSSIHYQAVVRLLVKFHLGLPFSIRQPHVGRILTLARTYLRSIAAPVVRSLRANLT